MNTIMAFAPLVILIVIMYFLMIRPQRKKDKQIQEMRKNLQVGDEIVTIGGICGKIVRTKEDSIIIQVGADKVKFEMMRWAVSTVSGSGTRKAEPVEPEEEEAPKKNMPKRLRRSESEGEAPAPAPAQAPVEPPADAGANPADEA